MPYSFTDDSEAPRMTRAVQVLIAINVAVFFLQLTVVRASDLHGAFGFQVRDLLERPWTAFTYMFVHAGFWHLAMNMYVLWIFGPRVEHAWSPWSFARYYVWCGLGGVLFHVMLASHGGVLVGASAAIYGVMLAYAVRWPDEELLLFFYIPIKVRWAVVLFAAANFVMWLVPGLGGDTAAMAHLGGFAFGWLYLRYTQSVGSMEKLRQRMAPLPDVSDETPRAIPRSQPRTRERVSEIDEIVARSNALATKRQAAAPSLTSRIGKKKAEELNEVLDKISQQGLSSLTRDERKLLEEMSKRLRNG